MFPADFAYVRARSLDDALDLLDEAAEAGDEAKLIAGGQSLLPMMKLRLATPQILIDIADLPELKGGGFYGPSHAIGALTTYRELSQHRYVSRDGTPTSVNGAGSLVSEAPALGDALAVLADPQVRARGTVGGAVAHGDPAADLPAVLLALDAEVVIAARPGRHEHRASPQRQIMDDAARQGQESNADRQTMLLDDFLQGIYATDLAEDEIVTHIRIDTRSARGSAYEKFPHPASHLPLAGVCAIVRMRDGLIEQARVAVTGISPRPYRARETERLLEGAPPAPDAIAAAAAQVTAASTVPGPEAGAGAEIRAGRDVGIGASAGGGTGQVALLGDQQASGPYRAHLAEVLARRALAKALTRAGHA